MWYPFSLGVPQSHPKITFNSISEVQPASSQNEMPKWWAFLSLNLDQNFIHFFLLPACWHNEITIYMVIFRSKEKFNAISGACTWPQIRNGIANFGALVCELEVRCLHLTVNSQWNHLIFTPKRSFGCENHNISPKCCVLSDFHLLRRWILVCKSHLHGICLNKKKCVHVYTCTIATQGVSPEL